MQEAASPQDEILSLRTPELLQQEQVVTDWEIRLSYADKTGDEPIWKNVARITRELDANERWVHRMLSELGVRSEVRPGFEGNTSEVAYPPYTVSVLRDELSWRRTFRELPSTLSVTEMSEHLGRSRQWVRHHLSELDIAPRGPQRTPAKRPRYGKMALKQLREKARSVPLDDGWLTVDILVESCGMTRQWVMGRLRRAEFHPEQRYSIHKERVLLHYPPQSWDYIIQEAKNRPRPAGDWLTTGAIAREVGRSILWVERRLEHYKSVSEIRLDDKGNERTHYPPSIIQRLMRESTSQLEVPVAVHHLGVTAIARRLGRSPNWVNYRLPLLDVEPEERRYGHNRVGKLYPDVVIRQLEAMQEDVDNINSYPKDDLLQARFAIGSMRARIRANKQLIRSIRNLNGDDTEQSNNLVVQNETLRRELATLESRYFYLKSRYNQEELIEDGVKDEQAHVDTPMT